ncbi:MAG: arsenite methyltransferase [Calditrichaceae bacterium]
MNEQSNDKVRQAVRDNYGNIASSCCAPSSCCQPEDDKLATRDNSEQLGYSAEELAMLPEGADLGLGCGNPRAIAGLKPGETVIDLGSGAGIDCFLAAGAVGATGYVIGVDMTPEMISKARENAEKIKAGNIVFRLGEIENLPVADQTADVIISNCVINLSPDKQRVFMEAFRVLKPGGRLAVSDIVATAPLPDNIKSDLALYTGCISGAAFIDDLKDMMAKAGFLNIRIKPKDESKSFIREWVPGKEIEDFVVSATIEAVKP